MSDQNWECRIEPAFDAVDWCLKKLHEELIDIAHEGDDNRSALESAEDEVKDVLLQITKIRNELYIRRETE